MDFLWLMSCAGTSLGIERSGLKQVYTISHIKNVILTDDKKQFKAQAEIPAYNM